MLESSKLGIRNIFTILNQKFIIFIQFLVKVFIGMVTFHSNTGIKLKKLYKGKYTKENIQCFY